MTTAPETLTTNETEDLLKAIANAEISEWPKWKRKRNTLIALLMLDAGLRVGEVAKLRISHLIFGSEPVRAIALNKTIAEKGCKRTVPLTERTIAAIKDFMPFIHQPGLECPENYVFFANDSRRHITTRQIERMIGVFSLTAFGRWIHPHVLRHTFATNLMRITSTPTVQQLLGHKHLTSTQVYTHPNQDDCEKAIKSLQLS